MCVYDFVALRISCLFLPLVPVFLRSNISIATGISRAGDCGFIIRFVGVSAHLEMRRHALYLLVVLLNRLAGMERDC